MPFVKQKISSEQIKSARILELQKKIQDESYLNNAIDRIAFVISRSLVENRNACENTRHCLMG